MENLTLKKISEDLQAKKFSSKELAEFYLDKIAEKNPDLNAYIHVDRAKTVAEAVAADERRAAGKELSEIDGVPLAIKDIINTKGTQTTCASKMLKDFVPPYDA
ncbi:MAG: amidase family protein, partial [Candidatus Altimarinota bacterium]